MEITEVERFTYTPGDRFVLHNSGSLISSEQAREIVGRFRQAIGIPDAIVVVMDRDWNLTIVGPDDEPA